MMPRVLFEYRSLDLLTTVEQTRISSHVKKWQKGNAKNRIGVVVSCINATLLRCVHTCNVTAYRNTVP
jgi:hypothetical protein